MTELEGDLSNCTDTDHKHSVLKNIAVSIAHGNSSAPWEVHKLYQPFQSIRIINRRVQLALAGGPAKIFEKHPGYYKITAIDTN